MIQQVYDVTRPGIDVVFYDNNRLERLCLEQDMESSESSALCIASARVFAELWRPDRFTVTLSAVDLGGPGEPRPHVDLEGELVLDVPAGDMITGIQGSVQGWNRIALPDGVEPGDTWSAVCADGMWPRAARVRPAPRLAGQATVWLRLEDAQPTSQFSLLVHSLGDAELRTMLGPSFFNPDNDPRTADYDVRGRPLRAWQAANLAIYDHTIAALEALGWRRGP
jgi:hypothetical protein